MTNQSEYIGFPENSPNDNSSYVEEQYVSYNLRPETFIVPVVFGIIFIAGVVGNGSLLMMFCRHKDMRSAPNMLIFNLALGDLLVLLVSVPFTGTIYTFESWPYGTFMCKFTEFARDTSVGVSVFSLTALSADRYFAIVHSVRKRVSGSKSKQMICLIVFIWILAVGLAMPGALFSHIMSFEISNTTNVTAYIHVCYPFPSDFGPNYPKVIVMVKALTHYIVPILVIGTFYSIMGNHLLRSTNALPGQAAFTQSGDSSPKDNNQPHRKRSRRKVVKMILSLVVLFAVCFFPNHVFFIWFHFDPNSHDSYNLFWHCFRIVGFCLPFINSCINPIALYIVSAHYRKHFNRILCCCREESSQVTVQCGAIDSNRPTHPLPLHNRSQFDPSNTSSTETSREQVQLHNLHLSEGHYP